MAEVIDSLLVRLGLEADERSFQDGSRMFNDIRQQAVMLGGVIATGLSFDHVVRGVYSSTTELRQMSEAVGVTTQQFEQLEYAMGRVGGTRGDAGGLLAKVNDWRNLLKSGSLPVDQLIGTGVDIVSILGMDDPNQALLALSDQLSATSGQDRARARDALGLNGSQTDLLTQGSAAIQAAFADRDDYGYTSDQDISDAKAFNDSLNDATNALNSFFLTLNREFAPALVESLNGFNLWLRQNQGAITDKVKSAAEIISDPIGYGNEVANDLRERAAASASASTNVLKSQFADWLDSIHKDGRSPQADSLRPDYSGPGSSFSHDQSRDLTRFMDGEDVPYVKPAPEPIPDPDNPLPEVMPPRPAREPADPLPEVMPPRQSYNHVDDGLLDALIAQESGGRHHDSRGRLITSPAGARGIAQIMPDTGADPGFGVEPLRDDSEEEHRRLGAEYLEAMMDRYGGDVEKSLAAYNAGPGAVDKSIAQNGPEWLQNLPRETREYVPSTIQRAEQNGSQSVRNYYQIDARGSNDPVAVEAAARRGAEQVLANAVEVASGGIAPEDFQ